MEALVDDQLANYNLWVLQFSEELVSAFNCKLAACAAPDRLNFSYLFSLGRTVVVLLDH